MRDSDHKELLDLAKLIKRAHFLLHNTMRDVRGDYNEAEAHIIIELEGLHDELGDFLAEYNKEEA